MLRYIDKTIIFKPLHNKEKEKCKKCDHGRCNLPLEEDKKYLVIAISDSDKFILHGWGSMEFHPECFIDVVLG